MKVVVGLGNVGDKYKNTRHNVGFILLDKLAAIYNLQFSISKKLHSEIAQKDKLILSKPLTMMNNSGGSVKSLATYYMLLSTDLYIVHDDLDIKLGEYKIQKGKGPKVHKGINSIEKALGTDDFWRVRVGVDNRDSNNRTPGEQYVLQDFTSEEKEILDKVLDETCKKLATL